MKKGILTAAAICTLTCSTAYGAESIAMGWNQLSGHAGFIRDRQEKAGEQESQKINTVDVAGSFHHYFQRDMAWGVRVNTSYRNVTQGDYKHEGSLVALGPELKLNVPLSMNLSVYGAGGVMVAYEQLEMKPVDGEQKLEAENWGGAFTAAFGSHYHLERGLITPEVRYTGYRFEDYDLLSGETTSSYSRGQLQVLLGFSVMF